MEFSWQEYWSGLPFPSPGDLPDPGIESLLDLGTNWTSELALRKSFVYVGDLLYRYVAKFWSSPDDIHLLKKIDNNFSLLIQRDDPLTSA